MAYFIFHPLPSSRLIQRWVDYITEALRSVARETLPLEKLSQAMDALTCQMLTFCECSLY